jgi:hypothetical protein
MPKCLRCNGKGRESYQEDDRMTTDVCYHCAGSGEVEPEVDLHDRLVRVAHTIAYQEEMLYRKARDNDSEGEGYEFCAAENMLSVRDYFQERVSDRQYKLVAQMSSLDEAIQNALLDWNERRSSERPTEPAPSPNGSVPSNVPANVTETFENIYEPINMDEVFGDDDIPF